MIININDSEFININHIVKVSLVQNVLRILFSTGTELIFFDKDKVDSIVKQLKIKANESLQH